MHGIANSKDLVSALLRKLLFCPFCDRNFFSQELKTHIRGDHSDKLATTEKRVELHDVDKETERIYICPHCHYAVGSNWPSNPTSTIGRHIIKEHPSLKILFSVSEDKELIQTYVKGQVEIKLLSCHVCRESFGAPKTLLEHLVCKHSYSNSEKISDETIINRIKNCVSIFLEKNKDKKTRIEPSKEVETRKSIDPDNTIESVSLEELAEELSRTRSPEKRQKPISSPPKPEPKQPVIFPGQKFSKTARSNEIDKGVSSFPPKLKAAFRSAEQIKVQFPPNDEKILPYDKSKGCLSGLKDWYLIKAIEPGDKILFRLLNQNPANIQIWTEWEKHLNYIIKCPPENFKWQDLPIRDCLLRVFAELMRPAHYHELYARISRHRDLDITSVSGVLSKYRGILFEQTSEGKWKWLQEPTIKTNMTGKKLPEQPPLVTGDLKKEDKIWSIIKEIKEKDLVYKLLDRRCENLSFNQICQEIAKYYNINWHEIRDTEFVNVNDPRLRRLENGHFALAKWFDEPKELEPQTTTNDTGQQADQPPPGIGPGETDRAEKAPSGFFKLFWNFCRRISGLLTKRRSKE